VELAPVIHYAARMAAAELKHRAKLVLDLADLAPVTGNETRLGQVFLNLLINAAQALSPGMADRHTITVSARVEGDRVIVSVSDTGAGMDPSLVARIFEPFVTTKSHGTGLGLAISHGIVSRLGGTIEVDSAPGIGTTFRVALPVARRATAEAPSQPEAEAVSHLERRPRVLVIDDEPLLIKATARILEAEADVVVADMAKRALALFEQGEHFDVILCDLLMPEMTGIELFTRVSTTWPELAQRFVFLTGGVFSRQAATFLETCGRPWLDKPFRTDALLALVHQITAQNSRESRP
ncbi:MAG: ATP-binding protein, partial [Kofleriaceae bacterium]